MRARLVHAVPADLRHLQRTSVERARVARDAAGDDAEAIGAILFAAIEQDLDTDADAEKGLPARATSSRSTSASLSARRFSMVAPAGTDAGQDHAIGGADFFRAIGYLARMAEVLERAFDARKVAGFVIDDRNHGFSSVGR